MPDANLFSGGTVAKPIGPVILPCARASDFIRSNSAGDQKTCQEMIDDFQSILPSSAAECSATLPNNPLSKAEILKFAYNMCCRLGSEANGVCGFQPKTATPCASKFKGEFLPRAT